MLAIEEAIDNVERLYRNLTGSDAPPPDVVYAPIPAERDPGAHVEEQLDRLLGVLGAQAPVAGFSAPVPPRTPPVSIWEGENELLLAVELPGVSKENVEVVMQGNLLVVTGKRPEMEVADMTLRASEVPLGTFRRTVALPLGVKKTDPNAQLRDGILEIRIAKEGKEANDPRPITVN